MRAAYVARYGPPEVVEFREVPTPQPRPGQVRTRVIPAAVTAGDRRVRSGELPRGFGLLRGLALGFRGPRQLAELAAKGTLRPLIDRRFPFERIADAYRIVDSRRKRGSVVVALDVPAAAR